MIKGHGDDIYQYAQIRMNFSSNICQHTDLSALKTHLADRLCLIGNYPEPEAWSLERLIARRHNIPAECVVVTSGATEAIYLVAQAFPYRHTIPTPTFSEYEDACRMFPLQHPLTSFWLCNPNNPTGCAIGPDDLRRLAGQHDLLVIDQSYEDYTAAPMLSPQEAVDMGNVLQLHSLTKAYGIPGLRIGYITASPRLTAQIRRYLRPWSVNALAIEAGRYLMEHGQPARPDLAEAQRLRRSLIATGALTVSETHTHFMLCEMHSRTAAELKAWLASEHGMLIRDAANFRGLTARHFRVAAQTPQENDALVKAINNFFL